MTGVDKARILRRLNRSESLTIREIGEALDMPSVNVRGGIKDLFRAGLIETKRVVLDSHGCAPGESSYGVTAATAELLSILEDQS